MYCDFSSANMISKLMGDVHLTPMIRMASFSFIFVGVLGVLRGYFQSKQEMNIPAISQVIEQLIRVCLIMIAILLFVKQHWSIYQAGTLAIIASSIGFLGSTLYLLAKRPFKLNLNNDKEKSAGKLTHCYTYFCIKSVDCYFMASSRQFYCYSYA